MWEPVKAWLLGAMAKYRYVKIGVTVVAVVLLVVIFSWPQKIGDTRTNPAGEVEAYYRGPNPNEPGRWVPAERDVDPSLRYSDQLGEYKGKKVKDHITISRGRVFVLLEGDTALILPPG